MTTQHQPDLVVSNNIFMAQFMEYVRDDLFFRLLGHESSEEESVVEDSKQESGIYRSLSNEGQYETLLKYAKNMYDLSVYLPHAREAGLQDMLHLCSVDPEHVVLAKLVGAFASRVRYPDWKDNPLSVAAVAQAQKTTHGIFLLEVSRSVLCGLSKFGYSSQFEGDPHNVALSVEKWLASKVNNG